MDDIFNDSERQSIRVFENQKANIVTVLKSDLEWDSKEKKLNHEKRKRATTNFFNKDFNKDKSKSYFKYPENFQLFKDYIQSDSELESDVDSNSLNFNAAADEE